MMTAPVCNVAPSVPPATATKINIPSIPVPNGNNTLQVLNAMREALLTMTNQTGQGNGQTNTGNSGNKPTPNNQFTITNQVISKVKVYDPNDPTQQTYVEVNQVTGLTMVDPVTGTTWSWSQPSSVPGSG